MEHFTGGGTLDTARNMYKGEVGWYLCSVHGHGATEASNGRNNSRFQLSAVFTPVINTPNARTLREPTCRLLGLAGIRRAMHR